ncbi:MAG: NAD+ synthase [Desulfobacterales bacterium]|nr:NAD+ synthase [Desulfobacterales bacterium]
MKIAIAQVNTIVGDFSHNFNRITHFAEQAKGLACDLVVFSELVISGYPSRDLLEKKDFIEANLACFAKLVDSIRGIGVICGYVDKSTADAGNPLFNAAALFENGAILHKVNKRLLPTYDIFDEGRYFEPGTQCAAFPYHGHQIGLTICEDVWNDKDIFKRRIYHSDPVSQMIGQGADLVVNISASPFYVGKREFRQQMLGSIARKYGVSLVYANQVGGNDSVLFDGISCAFDQKGHLIARANDFREDLVVFDTDNNSGDIHEIAVSDPESIFRALVMGTHDYVAKCGFSKVVVGLSGGIDSALTACIAVEALGKQNVLTVFMPSPYTSKDNYEDTQKLARNLDVELLNIPIDGMFKEFVRFLSPSFSKEDPGVVEQNLQARIRGTILMALSNKHGSLLLSTGNKSELAVGYCTLYGDMSGGLAVISDVPKTVIYKLAHYFNSDKETIPERIIHKAPSAELKPGQTDQDDLPPYEALDPILKSYIEDAKGADELVKMGYDKTLVTDIIQKVDRNEYKRHQAAPGLKVTSKAFGYGRRYPIAQRFKPELV